jgi:hypothetical protein
MVAETPRHVRGRLRHRSGPEPIGRTAESNQPYVLPLGADDTGSQITDPDTGRSLPPVMRAFCVLRARLRKDKHTVTARGVSTYSALVSHLAGTRRIGRGAFARDYGKRGLEGMGETVEDRDAKLLAFDVLLRLACFLPLF